MNGLEQDPGPLPDDLKAFFARHRRTGNASPQQLKRLAERLELPDESALDLRSLQPRHPLRNRAIVVALAVVTAGVGATAWVRQQHAAAIDLARTQWTKGDDVAAVRALERCASDACVRVHGDITRVASLSRSVSVLEAGELDALLDLYENLATTDPRRLAGRLATPADWGPFTRLHRALLLRSGVSGEHTNRALAAFERGWLAAGVRWRELAVPSLREVVALVPGSSLAALSEEVLATMPGPGAAWTAPPPGSGERLAALLVAQIEREPGSAAELLSTCVARLGDLSGLRCLELLADLHEQRALQLGSARDAEQALDLDGRLLTVSSGDARDRALGRLRALRELLATKHFLLTLAPGERREFLLARLQAASTSVPTVATVEVVGAEKFLLTAVGEGTTSLRAVTDDGEPHEWRVTVRGAVTDDGERQARRGTPQGAVGRLKLASNPMNAKVFIDGKDTGRVTPVLPSRPLEVPVGVHQLHFELDGKRSRPQVLVVTEGDNPVVRGELP